MKGPCTLDLTGVGITAGAPQQVKVSFPTGAPGDTAAIALLAKSVEDQSFSNVGSVRFTVTKYGVSVTPDSLALAPSAYASDTRTFTVTNSGVRSAPSVSRWRARRRRPRSAQRAAIPRPSRRAAAA